MSMIDADRMADRQVNSSVSDDLTCARLNGQIFNQASIDGHSTANLESKTGVIHLLAKIDGGSAAVPLAALRHQDRRENRRGEQRHSDWRAG